MISVVIITVIKEYIKYSFNSAPGRACDAR